MWSWGPQTAHLWKIWFDRHDKFSSLMSNVEIQVSSGIPWWQAPGAIVNTDMMTIGRGVYPGGKPGMSEGQYRIEVILYAMLSSPMVLSFDLSTPAALCEGALQARPAWAHAARPSGSPSSRPQPRALR